MKQAAALALAAVLPSVYAAPAATSSTAATVTAAAATDNPLAGYSFYANAYYASEVSVAAASLSSAGSTALAAQATKVAEVPSFYWL